MFEEITQIKGIIDGPTSIILAGVHGDEKCGVEAFKKIVPSLKIENGRVFFIYGNPRAIEKGIRMTNTNLNRMFKNDEILSKEEKEGYEYSRAQFLKKYLDQSEVLLDIHSSSNPNSKPFAICEENSKGIVEYLPIDITVSGFDNVEPGGTDYYMNSAGKIGICIECGFNDDPMAIQKAEEAINAFLKARGHIKNDIAPNIQSQIHMYELYFTKTSDFKISRPFKDFEEISKGEIIGIDGNVEIKMDRDGIILFAKSRKGINEEAYLLGEYKNSPA